MGGNSGLAARRPKKVDEFKDFHTAEAFDLKPEKLLLGTQLIFEVEKPD